MLAIRLAFLPAGWLLLSATAPMAQTPAPKIVGTISKIETVPNRPGTRCGNHLELTVLADGGKTVVLSIHDPKVGGGAIKGFQGKKVEIDLLGETVVQAIRLADPSATVAALENLSTRRMC